MNRIVSFGLEDDLFMFHHRHTRDRHHYFHAHQGLELLYIHEGEGQLILEQNIFPLQAGDLLLFQPFQLHKIDMQIERSPYVRTVIVLNPSRIDDMLASYPHYRLFFRSLWKDRLPRQLFRVQAGHALLAKLDEFPALLEAADPLYRKEEFSLFLMAVLQSLRSIVDAVPAATVKRREISYTERIMEWVEQHYRSDVRLDDLAVELHLSPYYISHLFRLETGSSIREYVAAQRLKEAFRLLVSTDLSVQRVAEQVGLKHATYFCQFFKKGSGMTPTQYRDRYLNRY